MKDIKKYICESSFDKKIYAEIAMTYQGLIGIGDKLLCNEPKDMKRFKNNTLKNIVIMGNNTFKSIDDPLKLRANIILSKSEKAKIISDDHLTPVLIGNDIIEMLSIIENNFSLYKESSIHIIGGSQIYELFEKYIDVWNITIWDDISPKDINNKLKNFKIDNSELKFFKPLHWLIIDNNLRNCIHIENNNNPNFKYTFLVLGK